MCNEKCRIMVGYILAREDDEFSLSPGVSPVVWMLTAEQLASFFTNAYAAVIERGVKSGNKFTIATGVGMYNVTPCYYLT